MVGVGEEVFPGDSAHPTGALLVEWGVSWKRREDAAQIPVPGGPDLMMELLEAFPPGEFVVITRFEEGRVPEFEILGANGGEIGDPRPVLWGIRRHVVG